VKKLKPRYSDDASKLFWDRIKRLPPDKKDAAYLMSCILQDTEARVLRYINAQGEAAP
jgi:hypothetical protein